MELQRYIDLNQSPDLMTFERRLVEMAGELEFPLVTALLIVGGPLPTSALKFHSVSNVPAGFLEASKHLENSRRDPVNKRLRVSSVPFVYTQDTYVDGGAPDLWEEQAAYGYMTGIAVAIHLPDHRQFSFGVDRRSPLPESDAAVVRLMAELQLVAVHAQVCADRLLGSPRKEGSSLSDVELEVLRWTMEGKTAWEVGRILCKSERTIAGHMASAIRQLGCVNKHHAVAMALRIGLIP